MLMHDCKECVTKGHCPLESIAPWLNEHPEEAREAIESCSDNISIACSDLVEAFPPAIMCKGDISQLAIAIFMIGLHKGRTYQDIPQVFKDGLKEGH